MGPSVSATDKLSEKARSFFLTDKNTPVIGAFASKVIQLFGHVDYDEKLRSMARWDTIGPLDVQYPNPTRAWMSSYCHDALENYQFDHHLFTEWLDKATVDTILTPPLCALPVEPSAKIAVHVDGVVIEPKSPAPTKAGGAKARGTQGAKKNRTRKPASSDKGQTGKVVVDAGLAPKKRPSPEKGRPHRRSKPSK